jgi:hypothetical protein
MSALIELTTKAPTPVSTASLAAFLTWKQFDLLLLMRAAQVATTSTLADGLDEVQEYDEGHGGAFYKPVSWQSTYSCLRSLERRALTERHIADHGFYEWVLTDRGRRVLEALT